jgi:hypothetical protein
VAAYYRETRSGIWQGLFAFLIKLEKKGFTGSSGDVYAYPVDDAGGNIRSGFIIVTGSTEH